MSFRPCGGLTRMGKLTYGMNVSVDGYIADTNGDIGWSDPDAELHQYWNDQVRDTAVSLYGRKLYELMSAHWPTADEAPDVSSVQAEFRPAVAGDAEGGVLEDPRLGRLELPAGAR